MLIKYFAVLNPLIYISIAAVLPKDDEPGSIALSNYPLIDGHNDLPWNLYGRSNNQIANIPLHTNLENHTLFGTANCASCHTDIIRLKEGKVGAQFWVAYIGCAGTPEKDLVPNSIAQIDVIKRFIQKYPNDLEFVTTPDGILNAFKKRKIAGLIALEGGHSMNNRLSNLRQYYDLGVRYMTLTHSCNLAWADASPVDGGTGPQRNLTDFGKNIVLEMNRLGMMVDLSHVSHNVMSEAIDVSKAPVIFSHSSAWGVHPHHRNVQDDVLDKVKTNNGIVMVNFYTGFVGTGNVTVHNVAGHVNYIVDRIGVDHVGIGADYDGVDSTPIGLENVSKYPNLFNLLREDDPVRWSIPNLEKLAGRNLIRVFRDVERVRDELANVQADESYIPDSDLEPDSTNSVK